MMGGIALHFILNSPDIEQNWPRVRNIERLVTENVCYQRFSLGNITQVMIKSYIVKDSSYKTITPTILYNAFPPYKSLALVSFGHPGYYAPRRPVVKDYGCYIVSLF